MEIAVTSERCSRNLEYPARTQKEIEDLFLDQFESNGHAGWGRQWGGGSTDGQAIGLMAMLSDQL